MKKIRVGHVITRLCKGGAQENTFHTVRLANTDRYEVDLISGPTIGQEGSIETTIAASGVRIHREPYLLREVSPINDLRALRGLTRRFRERRYDIVHTHTSKAGILGRMAARRAKIPIIVHTPHGNIFDGYFSPLKTSIFIRAERKAAIYTDRLIELTDGGIKEYLARDIGTRKQFTVIFSGIDLAPYDTAIAHRDATRAKLGLQPTDFLIGGVGRLEPVKGFTYFIEAAKRIAETVENAQFVHAGQGSLDQELRKLARPLGDKFRFLGLRDDIPDLMAAMDVLVVPSLNEGMGRVILEAGAAETPVVASRVGGVPDVVKDGETGMLVAAKSPGKIAQAVGKLHADPQRLNDMARAARAFVVPDFGLDEMVMRIEALYEELIEEKRLDT